MTMSDEQDMGPQKRPASVNQIVAQQKAVANELRSGSPLESVVQGRSESPVPSNPAVQGTPDILAKLRARAEQERDDAISFIHNMVRDKDLSRIVDITAGEIVAYARVVRWLDELGGCQSATQHEARSRVSPASPER